MNRLNPGSLGEVAVDKVAVIEFFFSSIFRAVVSLYPAGSIDPDAVAFFSPDEVMLYKWMHILPVYLMLCLIPCASIM